MSKSFIKYSLITLAIIILGVFLFVKFYIFRKSDDSVASKNAYYTIEAVDLLNSFETDETSANKKYLDKVIEVTGIVDNFVTTKTETNVYLRQPGKTSGIMCSFNTSEFQKQPIKSGDRVKIKGICSGYLLDVVLNKCSL